MQFTTRKLKGGWAIYRGRVRAFTTLYKTRRAALKRIVDEASWSVAEAARTALRFYL